MTTVLVLGASGYVGSHLVPRLVGEGHAVRAAGRRRETLEAREWEGVEVVQADALDRESLDNAFEGVDLVYYLVHSMASGTDFPERDRRAAEHARQAAEEAGVSRVVYLGGLQPSGASSTHLASRRETGDVLRAGAVDVTEVRAGIVVGPGSAAFEVIRDLVYHLPVMVTPRWVRSLTQPIALDDLIEYLVRLPETEPDGNHTYDVGGPEVVRYQDLLTRFAEAVGRRLAIVPMSVLSPRLSSYWLDLVTAVPSNVARPLIDGLRYDLVVDPEADLHTRIPIELRTYEEAVQAALEAERTAELPARWTEGSFAMRDHRAEISFYSRGERVERTCRTSPEAVWGGLGDRRVERVVLRKLALEPARVAGPPGGGRGEEAGAPAPDGDPDGRRARLLARRRGGAGAAADAARGDEAARHRHPRIRRSGGGRRVTHRDVGALPPGGGGGAAVLVRALADPQAHLREPHGRDRGARRKGAGGGVVRLRLRG